MSLPTNLFVITYLLVAVFWELPGSSGWRRVLAPLARGILWLGLEQTWGMFAPDPATSDRDLVVLLELPSGAAIVWEPPRLQRLSWWKAFLDFRYRSYEHAILYDHDDGSSVCRAALAEYLLRKYDFGDERPVAVLLTYVDRPIAPPGGARAAGVERRETRAILYTHVPAEPAG